LKFTQRTKGWFRKQRYKLIVFKETHSLNYNDDDDDDDDDNNNNNGKG
jgi:hypothetical protein